MDTDFDALRRGVFRINGGNELEGTTMVHGAKNAVLPLLAASVLSPEPVTINDCPYISDIATMKSILTHLGASVTTNGRSITTRGGICSSRVPDTLACAMRSSLFLLGAMLAVLKEAYVVKPGGCGIGARPYDLHLSGLKKMGVESEMRGDYVFCHTECLRGADVELRLPSVGATENLIIAAVLAKGNTRITGAAREPEIVDLADLLNAMGAKVTGAGGNVIEIEGVEQLHGATFTPTADRIVIGTLLYAVGTCGGKVALQNASTRHVVAALDAVDNVRVLPSDDGIIFECISRGHAPHDVVTGWYPLFPTDLQAFACAYACTGDGVSSVNETVFENRFLHVNELERMGALALSQTCARNNDESGAKDNVCIAGAPLHGATVRACDLRGGAALCVAALSASGTSTLCDVWHIDRGYERLESIFASLGADVKYEQNATKST